MIEDSAPPLPSIDAYNRSIVKPEAQLEKDFARVQIMRPAKHEAVVQQDSAISDVDALNVDRNPFAESFRQGKVKRRVRLEVTVRVR